MGPVLWARLAESGARPRRIVWEPRCRQSLGMSALGWEALNAAPAVSALCAVCVRGVWLHFTPSLTGVRGVFVFGPCKSVLKRLGNPENTIDYNRWIWLAVAEQKKT